MDDSKIRVELADGRSFDFEAPFAPPADRIALERRFSISIQRLGEPGALEEWVVFLLFRAAVRAVPELAETSFEDFLEGLSHYEIVGADATANPTDPEAPIG